MKEVQNFVPTPRIDLNPPVYFCPRAKQAPLLDGNIFKPFWENVPFSSDFVDISGPDFPTPRFRTRMKMCYDDENLYIAALMEGPEIWATIEKRDSVIYLDNDFEVFIDPSSSTQNYMELEINALNTQWDLMLTRPYRDGGHSVSCWDIKGVETAVHIEGKLGDPKADNRYWSAEIRIPFAPLMESYSLEPQPEDLARCYPPRTAPRKGEFWRMNFSRVNWQVDSAFRKLLDEKGNVLPEDNWVWAPTGLIDIHCPEFWGFVFFTEDGEAMEIPEDERRKLTLRKFYYAEYAWRDAHGSFCPEPEKLGVSMPDYPVTAEVTTRLFELSCPTFDGAGAVCLRSDGYTYISR